jgi:very-short-patch-repair endonuclease
MNGPQKPRRCVQPAANGCRRGHSLPARDERGESRREGLVYLCSYLTLRRMKPTGNARRLRRNQTEEEKGLWRGLRAGRFAGFKFRRQHPLGVYYLDFYCTAARLSVELDGFQHGVPTQLEHDEERARFLAAQDIEELRFWNHQWRKNRHGVLLEIWSALHRRTGWVAVMRKVQNHRYVPPKVGQFSEPPKTAD